MPHFICTTCGTQFSESDSSPSSCPICEDERQFVGPHGQQWTTLEDLRCSHRNTIRQKAPGLIGVGMEPAFAIGQRALLVRTSDGNILWDCVPLLDEGLVDMIRGLGGLKAIAISHPHYYTTMVEWARAFDCPVFLHEADREWVMRPDPKIEFWSGEKLVVGVGLTLIRCGDHFAGGTVLHWRDGAAGAGALLSGDIIQVVRDRRWVSFMRSYPNFIPLSAAEVQGIVGALDGLEFEIIYGAFWGWVVERDGRDVVTRSADRYVRALHGQHG
jgi:hypothetical protein